MNIHNPYEGEAIMSDKEEKGFLHGLSDIGHKLTDIAFPEDSEKTSKLPENKAETGTNVPISSSTSESSDPKIRKALLQVLKGHGGIFDQFLEMVESFRDVIPEEGQRYKVALVAMKKISSGFDAGAISKALDERIQALEGEHQKFLKTMDAQNIHIKELEQALDAKVAQIESLKKEIQKLEGEKGEIEKSVLQEREKVAKIQKTFESSLAEVQKEILESKAVIQKLLS